LISPKRGGKGLETTFVPSREKETAEREGEGRFSVSPRAQREKNQVLEQHCVLDRKKAPIRRRKRRGLRAVPYRQKKKGTVAIPLTGKTQKEIHNGKSQSWKGHEGGGRKGEGRRQRIILVQRGKTLARGKSKTPSLIHYMWWPFRSSGKKKKAGERRERKYEVPQAGGGREKGKTVY